MILGNVFQQLYNIVDSVVVGNFVGSDALAAVGASYPVTFLFIAVATGASIGCSVVISQFYGAKRITEMKSSVFTALTSMMTLSALLLLAGLLLARPLLLLMRTPGDIFSDADAYLRIYVAAAPFLFLYNTSTAAFNALGDSRTPLWLLMLSSVTNIFLDLLFVIRFGMGVPGVAWATLIAQALASLLAFFVLLRRLRRMPCEGKPRVFECERLRHICRVAVPSIIQQSIVSFGALFVQALVNGYGSDVIAGYTAATKIDSIAIMPMLNVGNAVSSFTAQNIGAGEARAGGEGPARGGRDVGGHRRRDHRRAVGVRPAVRRALRRFLRQRRSDRGGRRIPHRRLPLLRGNGDHVRFQRRAARRGGHEGVHDRDAGQFFGARRPRLHARGVYRGGRRLVVDPDGLDDRPRHRGRPVLFGRLENEIHH